MQGSLYTGTYAVNNVNFITRPSDGKWLERKVLGYDGSGHGVYPQVRSYELDWDFVDIATWNQITSAYVTASVTGSLVVDLPQYNRADFYFTSYSGVTMDEPSMDFYFVGNVSKMKVVFNNIITG